MKTSIFLFLWECRYIIAVLVSMLVLFVLEKSKFKTIAYAIMLQAKSLAKNEFLKSGIEQEDWVVKQLKKFIPYTKLIPEAILKKMVHYLYVKSKDYLDDGKFNNSVKE